MKTVALVFRFVPALAAFLTIVSDASADDATANAATAQEASIESIPAPPIDQVDSVAPSVWYGYQTLLADGAALALEIPSATLSDPGTRRGLGDGAALVYGLGGPIIHFSHGNVGKGFIDLGMRVALPVAGFFAGAVFGGMGTRQSGLAAVDPIYQGAAIGVLGGAIATSLFDAAVLAHDEFDAPSTTMTRSAAATWSVAPTFAVTPEKSRGSRGTVGLTGTF